MNAVVAVAAVSYKEDFGMSATQVGLLFLGLPLILMVVATVIVPRLVNKYGMQKNISIATFTGIHVCTYEHLIYIEGCVF
jgi:cyanate permease